MSEEGDMPTWRNREELVQQSIELHSRGMKNRAIARALGVSRNTVKKILRLHQDARVQPHSALTPPPARAPRESKLDPFAQKMRGLLDEYDDITAQRIFEELRAAGYGGSYTIVKEAVRKLRPAKKPDPSLEAPRFGPGKMAESDWSPYTIDFTAAGRQLVQVCAYVLAHSRRKSFGVYERSDFYALTAAHVASFTRFEGAAEECKYDSQKAVVLGWEANQPIYNPRLLGFSTYYEYKPRACRRFHPNDKPHVERAFWEFERSFLNGRRFRDPDDMRAQLAQWERTTCDLRPSKRDKTTALQRFAEEQPHLRELPCHPYDTARVVYRLCSIDGFVSWDGNRYAIPYDHVTDFLPVRITQRELFVYAADLTLVARHELGPRSAGHDLDPMGFHRRDRRQSAADLDQVKKTYDELGEDAACFFARLLGRMPTNVAGYHARQILLLRERYASSDLGGAFRHALAYDALDHRAVERILTLRATPRRLAEYVAEETERKVEALFGAEARPRDLDEYDQLPLTRARQEDPCPDETSPLPTTSSSSESDDTSKS
jgi:transposase